MHAVELGRDINTGGETTWALRGTGERELQIHDFERKTTEHAALKRKSRRPFSRGALIREIHLGDLAGRVFDLEVFGGLDAGHVAEHAAKQLAGVRA